MNSGKKSFWTTLPGILTGLASLITALTGLWLVFYSPSTEKYSEKVDKTTDRISTPIVNDTTTAAKATKKYWDSLLFLERGYFVKAIQHRKKASDLLRNEPFNANQFIEHLKSAASLMRKHVSEVEKLPTLNVDPELLTLTAEGLFVESDWASEMSHWASLWDRPELIRKYNLTQQMQAEQNKTMDKQAALVDSLNDNSDAVRLLRIKLVDKYRIELPLP